MVIAEGMRDADMFDVVRVSSQRLIGEIIEMHGDKASIQVYEETSGLGPGEAVVYDFKGCIHIGIAYSLAAACLEKIVNIQHIGIFYIAHKFFVLLGVCYCLLDCRYVIAPKHIPCRPALL